jgi:hypothetical protein
LNPTLKLNFKLKFEKFALSVFFAGVSYRDEHDAQIDSQLGPPPKRPLKEVPTLIYKSRHAQCVLHDTHNKLDFAQFCSAMDARLDGKISISFEQKTTTGTTR